MGVYSKSAALCQKHLKPEIKKQLTKEGVKAVAMILTLASQHGSGDAYAGMILRQQGKGIIENLTGLLEALKGPELTSSPALPHVYFVLNFDKLVDFFLKEEFASKLKKATVGGKGVGGVSAF